MTSQIEQIVIAVILFGIIVVIGQLFRKSTVPITLILVITGMLLSLVPKFPRISLSSELVLNIFLPILIYQIGSFSSWKDTKKNLRPITLLSVGHVVFITFLIATLIHILIPQLGWPLAFVFGAIISPPDDVAIVSIAEKIRMPERILTILEGEGMFNDATALIIFRFALAVVITHQFSFMHAVSSYFAVVIGETLYGLLLGFILGELRTKIRNTTLHMIASILTPFLAYIPAIIFGGCGVLATAITGFIIGNRYATRFTPEFRLFSLTFWPMLSFIIQSIVFLLVGLDLRFIIERISTIPLHTLLLYSAAIITLIIIGRFIWVYSAAIIPRFLFPQIRKNDPYPPWQYLFVISWAGMRGGISLAAALAVPILPEIIHGANARDLLIFLVFCVIAATFILQGLTLPWLTKVLGVQKFGQCEEYNQHLIELKTRKKMAIAVLRWLADYEEQIKNDKKLHDEVKLYIREYRMLKNQLREQIANHDGSLVHDENAEAMAEAFLLSQIIEVERLELIRLWHEEKINLVIRNKLLARLDHRAKHLPV